MKRLIFIDNDNLETAEKCVKQFISPFLEAYGGLTKDQAGNIEIFQDLYKADKDKLYDLFFEPATAILSWSTYGPNSDLYNSESQLLHFLRVAGSANVTGAVYIDVAGTIVNALTMAIKYRDVYKVFDVLCAIQRNQIITLVDGKFKRLKLRIGNEEVFELVEVDLQEVLCIKLKLEAYNHEVTERDMEQMKGRCDRKQQVIKP